MKHKSLESSLKDRILRMLADVPRCWAFKTHGGQFQKAGIPDIVGCHEGRFFGIELKRPDENNGGTGLQKYTIRCIAAAGGISGIAESVEDVKQILGIG